MATLPTLLVGDSAAPNGWTSAPNGALTAIGDAGQDTNNGHVATNTTGDYDQGWALGDTPSDFANMDTLSVQLRYGWSAYDGSLSTWPSLSARIMSGATVLAGADAGGGFQSVATSITTTTPTNSGVVGFSYVNTTADKTTWDAAVVEIRIGRNRNKGGSTAEQRIYAAQWTGTYSLPVPTGTVASGLVPLSATASGTHEQTGTVASALVPLSADATGTMHPSGTVASSLVPLSSSATGSHFIPDVAVTTAASAITEGARGPSKTFWLNETTAAVVYSNGGNDMCARKTTDSGASWGSDITVEDGTVGGYACWYDRETPGDNGTLIHTVWADLVDGEIKYAAFDVSAGTWSSVVTIDVTGVSLTGGTRVYLSKTRSGNLVMGWRLHSIPDEGNYKSTNGGTSWTSIASPWTGTSTEECIGISVNTGDGNDAGLVRNDSALNPTDGIQLEMYDDSANTWTGTSIFPDFDGTSLYSLWGQATRLSDGHAIFGLIGNIQGITRPLEIIDINANSIASPSSTRHEILADTTTVTINVAVSIDPSNDDIYVHTTDGTTALAETKVVYYKSTDGGSTWGSQQPYQGNAEDDIRAVGGSFVSRDGGYIMPVFFNDDLLDLFVNTGAAIEIAAIPTGTIASSINPLTSAAEGTAAAAGATGTASSSLVPLTATASGVMQPSGAVASSLVPLSAAATGAHAQTGAVASALVALSADASGAQAQSGTVASSLQPLTSALAGTHAQTGTVASSLQPLTAAAEGTHTAATATGTVASSLQSLTSSLSGEHTQSGSITSSLQPLTSAASGVMQPSGTVASAIQPLTASAAGELAISGTVAASLQPLTSAATGVMQPSGAVASSIQPLTSSLAGTHAQSGSVASSIQPLTAAATGVMHPSGSVASSIQPLTSALSGTSIDATVTGSVASSIQPLTAAASGTQAQTGTVTVTLQPLTSTLTGTQAQSGTIASTLQPLSSALSGTQTQSGTIASSLQPLTAAATGAQPFTGTATGTIQPLTAAATGASTSAVTGTIASTIRPLTATATGTKTERGTVTVAFVQQGSVSAAFAQQGASSLAFAQQGGASAAFAQQGAASVAHQQQGGVAVVNEV